MIQSAKCLHKIVLLILFLCYFCVGIVIAQTPRDTVILREQISKLQGDLEEQKTLTSKLLERNTEIIDNQGKTISNLKEFSDSTRTFIDLQKKYKDAFVFNRDGKPYAYIDFPELKLYEYATGKLLGWIDANKNEVIRNYDGSTIATIENDFLIDAQGSPIGSIERSETLKWEREKLMIQKTPESHFFVMAVAPQQFIQTQFRTSDWSTQKIEDLLFFSEKNIQKLK